jgi:uncharacterized protein (UPF0335 family)
MYDNRTESRLSSLDATHFERSASSTSISRSLSVVRPSFIFPARERERCELSTLNDKFADYIEKVRYLEAQNRKIQMDSNHLYDKQQDNGQRMKSMFEIEMKQLKETIEKICQDKSTVVVHVKDMQVRWLTSLIVFICTVLSCCCSYSIRIFFHP